MKGINDHRNFHIAKRDDGAVCFWYKPDSVSASWYPSKMDDNNDPIKESYIAQDGSVKERYAMDPRGIEIFQTKDGPPDAPKPAEFPPPIAERHATAAVGAGIDAGTGECTNPHNPLPTRRYQYRPENRRAA